MAEEVLGSGIPQGVVDQINLRQTLIGSPKKERDQLLFFNGNGAWIRLASSVNTQTEGEVKDFKEEVENFKTQNTNDKELKRIKNLGSSILAKDNVLLGGMYPQGTSPGGGGLLPGRHTPLVNTDGYISPSVSKLGSYHDYDSLGYRPVPGIISATVQSKNTYGTLREAEVKVVVWTLEDLEVMQALYLRPGYSILMEWGHSLGLSNDGKINSDIRVITEFFERRTQAELEEKVISNRSNSDFNYDALYGYISNFSWSFRQDGGYDCTVKIISKGAIVESLALAFDTTKRYPSNFVNSEDKEKLKEERKSIFHKFRAELDNVTPSIQSFGKTKERPNARGANSGKREDASYPWIYRNLFEGTGEIFKKKLNDFRVFPIRVKEEISDGNGTQEVDRSKYYVTLGVILDIYNNFCTVENTGESAQRGKKSPGYGYTQYYTGWQDKELDSLSEDQKTSIPYQKESKFVTSIYHFSINPRICIHPIQVGSNRGLKFFKEDCTEITAKTLYKPTQVDNIQMGPVDNLGTIQLSNFDLNVIKAFDLKQNIRGEADDVLNILICLDHVIEIIDNLLQENKDSDQNTSNNMVVFMKRLLQDVNDSLGGVNDLDVTYEEDENLFYVIDRRLTPKDPKKLPKINFAGLNSTITDLNISSKISSNISSQISIAAQAGNSGTKDNLGPLLQWNKGLVDRHLSIKGTKDDPEEQPQTTSDEPERTRLEKWLVEYNEVWREFKVSYRIKNGRLYIDWEGNRVLDFTSIDNLNSLAEYHKEYCQTYVAEYYFKKNKSLPPPGTIPVELSFKTIGIGGLKIGLAFGFQRGVLPQTYTDDYGFIITGLSHDISGNRWTTEVKALFFCATPPPDFVIREYRETIGLTCSAQETESTPEPTPTEETVVEEVVTTTDSTGETTTTTTTTTTTNTNSDDLGTSVEWWTLVAICYAENFPGNLLGYADVAQSIYNRSAAGYYGGSIVRNINAAGQYEPVFGNKQDWANIRDIDTAAVAILNYKSIVESKRGRTLPSSYNLDYYKQELKKCSDALQNKQLKQEAARFVGSRTEFLAYTPTSALAVGPVERQPSRDNNSFFWRYDGKDLFYNNGRLSATDFNIVSPPDNAVV